MFNKSIHTQELEKALNIQPIESDDKQPFFPKIYDEGILDEMKELPKRAWLIYKMLLRGYVSVLVAPGGVGKSLFQLAMAATVASYSDFLSLGCVDNCNVLIINNEDDESEFLRRYTATIIKHDLDTFILEATLFQHSGYGNAFTVAKKMEDGSVVRTPNVKVLKSFIRNNNIGAVFIDPFISTHDVPENDNTGIDKVVQEYKALAYETNAAFNLVHHTKKSGSNSEIHAGDAEAGRGASSLKDAARSFITLAKMSESSAKIYGIREEERHMYIRLDLGKSNYTACDDNAMWFKKEAVLLPNGEYSVALEAKTLVEVATTDDQAKWLPEIVAGAIEPIFPKKVDKVPWSDIKRYQ